jgi:hypothetical protein
MYGRKDCGQLIGLDYAQNSGATYEPVRMMWPSPLPSYLIPGIIAEIVDADVQRCENAMPDDVFLYSPIVPHGGGSIRKGGATRKGSTVFEITGANNTDYFGITLDMSQHPELAGKLCYLACEFMLSEGKGNCSLWMNDKQLTDSYTGGTGTWRTTRMLYESPTSGLVKFGVAKISDNSNSVLSVSRVVLTALGTRMDEFFKHPTIPRWSSPAAPTTGTWSVGDIVYNSKPAPSSPIGWVCVAAGSPGTWKSFGELSA